MILADFHIHTIYSNDSTITPKNLVECLVKHNFVKVAAITDHNTIESLEKTIKLATPYSDILIIPGIEISTVQGDILGSGNIVVYGEATSTLAHSLVIDGHIWPSADAVHILGSSSYRWANIYSATTTIGDTIVIDTDDIKSTNSAINITTAAASTWKTTSGALTIQSADVLTATSTGDMIFASGGEERMRILSTGNIGIATTTPETKLEVTDIDPNPQIRISEASGGGYSELYLDATGDLRISATGGDIEILDENLWVCADGSCPAGNPNDTGNLMVENSIGIASSTPSTNLSVQGNILGSENIVLYGTATSSFSGPVTPDTIKLEDDKKMYFGAGFDAFIRWNTASSSLQISVP